MSFRYALSTRNDMANSPPNSSRQLQLVAKKSHAVCQCVDPHTQGKDRRVPAEWAVVEKDRIWRIAGRLQPRRHFSCMQRITVAVGVSGNDHRRWIRDTAPHLVVR